MRPEISSEYVESPFNSYSGMNQYYRAPASLKFYPTANQRPRYPPNVFGPSNHPWHKKLDCGEDDIWIFGTIAIALAAILLIHANISTSSSTSMVSKVVEPKEESKTSSSKSMVSKVVEPKEENKACTRSQEKAEGLKIGILAKLNGAVAALKILPQIMGVKY